MENKLYFKLEVVKRNNLKTYYDIYLYFCCFLDCNIFHELVFHNVEGRECLQNFIDSMNLILEHLNGIKQEVKSNIKFEIEKLLQNYKEKNPEIKKAFENINNKKGIIIACSLFEFIYSERNKIGAKKINNFIESINLILDKLEFLEEIKKIDILKFLKDLFKAEEKELSIKELRSEGEKPLTFSNKLNNQSLKKCLSLKKRETISTNSQHIIEVLKKKLNDKEEENKKFKEIFDKMEKKEQYFHENESKGKANEQLDTTACNGYTRVRTNVI